MTTIKQNKHIEVVISSLSGLNIMSAKSCVEICNVLKKHFTEVGTTVIKKESDLEDLVRKKPDLVFSGVKYVGFTKSSVGRESPDKIWLSEYLESKGINYTGSKVAALKLEFDKILAKEEMQKNDINTAPFFIAEVGQYKVTEKLPLPFPLFVKPIYEGSGNGIGKDSVITNFKDFETKVESIYEEFGNPSLVEKYLSGREFTVGIIDSIANEEKTAMPVELIAVADNCGNKILSYEAKKDDCERLIPLQDPKEHKQVSDFAKKAFTALGARDYGRIDIRMDGSGTLYFLEANLLPGLNPIKSYFIKTCKKNNQSNYEDAILKIAEIGLRRSLD
ncbi:MAG: D-alanine--D-alanine ligase [Candidatus Peregrinibacteria bacterium]|nr:D-alanine--D-alanine ligase [Candidatus Peregrinibacteria bacterium]